MFLLRDISFNSKLVRLKVRAEKSEVELSTFQFQTGSIKSRAIYRQAQTRSRFQFQTGSIKSQRWQTRA